MKGLVFRELYLGRKNILLTTLVWIMFVIIGILIRLSMLYGNMAKLPLEDLVRTETVICNAFIYAPILVLMSANMVLSLNTFSDYTTKWALFGYASPVSEYRYIGAKFLLMGGISFAAFMLNLVNTFVMCTLCDRRFDSNLVLSLLCVVMCMIFLFTVGLILVYKFRSKKKLSVFFGITAVVIYGGIIGGMFYLAGRFERLYPNMSNDQRSEIMDKYLINFAGKLKHFFTDKIPLFPFVFIAVMVVLYFVCVKVMKRREC